MIVMLVVGEHGADGGEGQRIVSMTGAGFSADWYAVNDGVMGGVSVGQADMDSSGRLIFTGEVSFENNGGFASIRHDARTFRISQSEGVRIKVKGDGKKYQFRVSTGNGFRETTYQCTFTTVQDEWQEVGLRWEEFKATYRGRFIPDAPALEGSHIREIGFLIADKQEGPFRLEIESIGPL